jgi:putative molybdopterin biosynthesis protein
VDDLLRPEISFINRNKGSGTRFLIDRHLAQIASIRGTDLEDLAKRVHGYGYEAKSHSAVASAVKNDRADVGFGIKTAAAISGLDFIKLDDEKYDFLISKDRLNKKSIEAFIELLQSKEFSSALRERAPGLTPNDQSGKIIFQP